MSDNDGNTLFEIKNKKFQVPLVTLSTGDNVKVTKQLTEGFKRSVSWNQYKTNEKKRFR